MDATELESTGRERLQVGWRALGARILAIDVAFFRLLAAFPLPKAIAWPLILLVRVGDGWIWGIIAVALWFALPFAQVETVVLQCALAIAVSLCIYLPVKFIAKRLRPYDSGLDVTPMVPPLDKYSFPSGHTMNNLAVSLVLTLHFPRLLVPAVFFPLLLGTLRVLFGVHYLSDILGGGLLGICAFSLAKAVFPFITF